MTDRAAQDLSPFIADGWSPDYDLTYYVHRNRLYLQGALSSDTGVSTVILTGLPEDVRPGAVTAVVVYVSASSDDPATPGIVTPQALSALVMTDGSLVLSALPPFIADVPNGALTNVNTGADFTSPLFYSVIIGNINWQIAGTTPLADVYSGESLAPYLHTDFEDIDSTIAKHDARVHLGGRVRATKNNASTLSSFSLPTEYVSGLGGGGEAGDMAVLAPSGRLDLQVFPDRSAVITADEATTLTTPTWTGAPGTYPTLTAHPDTPTRGARRQKFALPPGVTPLTESWDHGTFICAEGIFTIPCFAEGAAGPWSSSIATLVALYYPAPDWFALNFATPSGNFIAGSSGCGPPDGLGNPTCIAAALPPIDVTVSFDAACDIVDSTGAHVADNSITESNPFVGSTNWPLSEGSVVWVARPGFTAEYDREPNNLSTALLWRPGEINSIELTVTGDTHSGDLELSFGIVPYWERRQWVVLEGDEIDLTGCGWQATYVPPVGPPPPSTVAAGVPDVGILPR